MPRALRAKKAGNKAAHRPSGRPSSLRLLAQFAIGCALTYGLEFWSDRAVGESNQSTNVLTQSLFGLASLYHRIDPGRQTIALCGDGGFTMLGLGDLLTQVQRKTRVLHIIFNNESLNFVGIEQQEAGILPFGVDFKNPNFAKVAEAMGAKGIRLEEPGDVKDALAEALAHTDGPVVVDAVVDRLALSLPSHVPFHVVKGFTLSMAKQVLSGRMDTVIKTMERNLDLV